MNKVETQTRILRHLAIIQYQVALLGSHGQNISSYTETAVLEAMSAITGRQWINLNGVSNNFPGIDLTSPDRLHGVQATANLTKNKFDKTADAIRKELDQPKNRLAELETVEVIGLACVTNPKVTSWTKLSASKQSVDIRGISLERRLGLENASEAALNYLDRAFQGLASTSGVYQMRSDREELQTVIIPFLDRPAIRDKRPLELDWLAMQNAMMSIRRLLGQGVNDIGVLVTRPYSTFQPEAARLLKQVYDETSAISMLLREELRAPGSLQEGDEVLLDGHRLRIQERVTMLALGARITPPTW